MFVSNSVVNISIWCAGRGTKTIMIPYGQSSELKVPLSMSASPPMYMIRYICTNTGVGMLCIITLRCFAVGRILGLPLGQSLAGRDVEVESMFCCVFLLLAEWVRWCMKFKPMQLVCEKSSVHLINCILSWGGKVWICLLYLKPLVLVT